MPLDAHQTTRRTRRLVIERVIDAPRERVFRAWTEPDQLMRWWAPEGSVATFCATDLRAGGRWSIYIRSPDGSESCSWGIYRQIQEPELLILTLNRQEPVEEDALKSEVTVRLAEEGEKTRFIFEQVMYKAAS